jgi:hypothetical protein
MERQLDDIDTCDVTCYKTVMLRTYVYIPDELENQILMMAKLHKKSKAEVIRQALETGMTAVKQKSNGGVQTLFDLAELGKKYNIKGPKDLSKNMDHYLWGMSDEN